jgi:2-methylcitrate dehydratase PrpD
MRSSSDMRGGSTFCEGLAETLVGLPTRHNAPARAYARRALLDTLGAALAGTTAPESQIVNRAIVTQSGGEAPVWGTALLLSAGQAALANGTAAHALEVDDFGGCGHSGAVVIPAVLAAASRRDVSGADLIDAIILGYEAAARVTDAMGGYPAHNAAGWHSTGTCGAFGAAAASAHLLGLDVTCSSHALALAGSYTGGTWSFMPNGAMNKRLHAGKAAEAGITAALLAAAGFTGPLHLFEPIWGSLIGLYAGEAGSAEALTATHPDLLIFRSGFKPYACCRGCHSALDVVLSARLEHGFTGADIEKVNIFGSDQTVRQLGKQHAATMLDAQMSLPYSVAVALLHGSGELHYYQEPYLSDPEMLDLASRVSVYSETAVTVAGEPRLEIFLRDGRRFDGRVDVAKGAAANPLSDREIEDKFTSLATMSVSPERASAIAAMVATIEKEPSIAALLALLAKETSQ